MKLGFATPISLRLMQDLVAGGDRLPVGYEFAPAADWVRELLRRGHHVVVYTEAKDIDRAETFVGEGLTIRIARQRVSGSGRDLASQERVQLTRMMHTDACDVIHAHWTYEFALAALASNRPTLITIHDLPWNVLRYFRDGYRVARVLMAFQTGLRGRYFTAVSQDAAAHFQRYFAPKANVVVVPNCLPDSIFRMGAQSATEPREWPVFATVLQGWSARKNAVVAIEAFQRVRFTHPGVTMRMYGADYETCGPACRWALTHGLSEGVTFVGKLPYRDLLQRLSHEIDVLVHPSLDESFSMAALEAMALKKPVIAGRETPGIREVLDYGAAGVLVDMKDAQAVAGAMTRFIEDKPYREQIAHLAYRRACITYRVEPVFDQYERLYQQIYEEAQHA